MFTVNTNTQTCMREVSGLTVYAQRLPAASKREQTNSNHLSLSLSFFYSRLIKETGSGLCYQAPRPTHTQERLTKKQGPFSSISMSAADSCTKQTGSVPAGGADWKQHSAHPQHAKKEGSPTLLKAPRLCSDY